MTVLKSNKLNVLISIVSALVIWTYVSVAINPPTNKTFRNVPVELINLESLTDRGLTVDLDSSYTVDVAVRGTRAEINAVETSNFRATVDMTGYPKGENSVKVNVTVPNGVEWVQTKPELVSVLVEDLVEVTKPIEVSYASKYPGDVEPGFVTVTPEEIEVAGTESAVSAIDHVKVVVPEEALTESETTLQLDPVAINKQGEPAYNVKLSADSVDLTATLLKKKDVALSVPTVGVAPENIEITNIDIPKTVTIKGTDSTLAKISSVNADAIDLAEITGTAEILLSVQLPDGVELANASKKLYAKIDVQGIAKKDFTFEASEIEVEGLTGGLSGHINTDTVTITILAEDSVIGDITKADIQLYVDAQTILAAVDSIEMDILYRCEKNLKSIVLTPVKVRVTVIG